MRMDVAGWSKNFGKMKVSFVNFGIQSAWSVNSQATPGAERRNTHVSVASLGAILKRLSRSFATIIIQIIIWQHRCHMTKPGFKKFHENHLRID